MGERLEIQTSPRVCPALHKDSAVGDQGALRCCDISQGGNVKAKLERRESKCEVVRAQEKGKKTVRTVVFPLALLLCGLYTC